MRIDIRSIYGCFSLCIGIVWFYIRNISFFTADDRIINPKPISELKKESQSSQFKLELQNTTSFIRNNDNEIISGLYESEYKPLALQRLREAAAEGRIDKYIKVNKLVVEHIEEMKLKLSEFDMIWKIYEMFEKDPVFKGFHITTYRSTDDEKVGLYFSWK
jgi:hypothetical protein